MLVSLQELINKESLYQYGINVSMSEWLRRQTRNLLCSARAGSNPAADAFFDKEDIKNNNF